MPATRHCHGQQPSLLYTQRRNHTFRNVAILISSWVSLWLSMWRSRCRFLQPLARVFTCSQFRHSSVKQAGLQSLRPAAMQECPLSAGGGRLLVRLDPNRKPRTGTTGQGRKRRLHMFQQVPARGMSLIQFPVTRPLQAQGSPASVASLKFKCPAAINLAGSLRKPKRASQVKTKGSKQYYASLLAASCAKACAGVLQSPHRVNVLG